MTHRQLLEGLKEKSQVEDNRKREGVGARSLTHSTRGVKGRARAPGLGLGRMTSLIHLLELASNLILHTLGVGTSHGQPWTHLTHHGPDSGEATTFPHIV
jgi:hypothetical protein